MNKIEIKIPDGLTPHEETIAIAKKLNQKALSGNSANKSQILIGQELNISHTQTQIIITRIGKEKPIELVTCNCCGREYQNNAAVYYWHNYGGKSKKVAVCSTECQEAVISFLGDRAATSSKKLKPVRFY